MALQSTPSKITLPPAIGTSPAMLLSNELLPAPFEPIIVTTSPARTCRDTPLNARIAPYSTVTSRRSSTASLRDRGRSRRSPLLIIIHPEISGDDGWIALDLRRGSLGNLPAIVKDDDVVGD